MIPVTEAPPSHEVSYVLHGVILGTGGDRTTATMQWQRQEKYIGLGGSTKSSSYITLTKRVQSKPQG